MWMRAALFAVLLCSSAAGASTNASTSALTVDQLVARYLEARGGAANLAALQSVRTTGTVTFGGGSFAQKAAFGEVIKRPGKVRDETTMQGLTSVDSYDGKEAWHMNPFGGRREAERGSADEARGRAVDADLEGPLVNWREKGHQIEYLGTEDVDGTQAHKLRIRLKGGDQLYAFLDPDYFLEIREQLIHNVRGVEQISETDLGSYQQVNGVWFPFSIEQGSKGGPRSSRYTIERLEANVALDDALFPFPAPGAAVGRAVIAGPASPGSPGSPGSSAVPSAAPFPPAGGHSPLVDAGVISGLGARNIGSAAMSGRIAAVAAHVEGGKTTLFVGAASGGVWKSLDGGTTFNPVFDKQPVQSIGAIAIDPKNPKVIWVGTGESWTRNSVSIGNGIYKSTDGGESWVNQGLPNSERIVRIAINPNDGKVVYACVPGKLWSDSPDRGLYKTTDGGKSWDLILTGPNLSTGCSGLSMDSKNPEVLFAGLWDFRRKGWTFRSGGASPEAPSGSALFRTADGGKSWTELSASGLPAKPWGRIEVAAAPSDGKIVYALIEAAKDSALYRSADGGATWEARDRSQGMIWRPFYFAHLIIDPLDPDRLFKPGGGLIVSEDGGRSFASAGGGSHGDWHDLWIDPTNPKHVIGGDDGGLFISYDGGSRWWKGNNLPISQFYHVSVDDQDPYKVYGGLQDNSTWVGDSSYPGGISNSRWENIGGGDGFWAVLDPSDAGAIYVESQGGYIERVDLRTRARRDIQPKARLHEKLRFNWNTPIAASPTDHKSVYLGSQFLFRSRDRGENWERISPDLSSNDPEKQKQEETGGVTVDNSSAEMHTTIYSISESPLDSAVIWVGTDDGNVQLTRDGGKSWANQTGAIKGLPPASWVSWIEASRFDKATAYATFDRHTYGDMTAWVYRTTDFGKSWARIAGPAQNIRGYAHVIKEDRVTPGLLFLGTEFGLWISLDNGKNWAEFKGGDFPSVAVRDLQVQPREGDLVLATHGRGIWIIDDLSPLRELTAQTLAREAAFLPRAPVQQRMQANGGWVEGDATFVGDNRTGGAVITYYQRTRHLFGPIKLEVLDPDGKVIETLSPTKRRGINRVAWNMRVKPPRVPRAATLAGQSLQGPRVLPGIYTARLTKGAQVVLGKFEIVLDRRAPYGLAERKEQFEAVMRVHALFGEMSTLADRISSAGAAAIKDAARAEDLQPRLGALTAQLQGLRKKIVATKEGGAITGEERLREHADILYGALQSWEGRPPRYLLERIDALTTELGEVKTQFEALLQQTALPLNLELRKRQLELIPLEAPAEPHAG